MLLLTYPPVPSGLLKRDRPVYYLLGLPASGWWPVARCRRPVLRKYISQTVFLDLMSTRFWELAISFNKMSDYKVIFTYLSKTGAPCTWVVEPDANNSLNVFLQCSNCSGTYFHDPCTDRHAGKVGGFYAEPRKSRTAILVSRCALYHAT